MAAYRTIIHATDFSDVSASAFAHALKMALAARARLYLLHVGSGGREDWHSFPHVRHLLQQWRLLGPNAALSDLSEKLGIKVVKASLKGQDISREISQFAHEHEADLLVLGTHGREGLPRWLLGSVAEEIATQTWLPALFVGQEAKPFVEPASGRLRLARALVPVDHTPKPAFALNELNRLANLLKPAQVMFDVVHVGENPPHILNVADGSQVPVQCVPGEPVEKILELAREQQSDLVVMPTAGRQGLVEAFRGSTTQQVVREAPCPVLALPT